MIENYGSITLLATDKRLQIKRGFLYIKESLSSRQRKPFFKSKKALPLIQNCDYFKLTSTQVNGFTSY